MKRKNIPLILKSEVFFGINKAGQFYVDYRIEQLMLNI